MDFSPFGQVVPSQGSVWLYTESMDSVIHEESKNDYNLKKEEKGVIASN